MEKQNIQPVETLFELAAILNTLNDFDEILRVISEKVQVELQAETVLIMMLNPDTQKTVKTAVRTGSGEDNQAIRNLKMQVTGWMSSNNSSFLSDDIMKDGRFVNLNLNDLNIKSVIASMIKVEDEEIGSIIIFNSPSKNIFKQKDLEWLEKVNLIAAPYIRSLEHRRGFFKPEVPDSSLINKYKELGLLGKSPEFIALLHSIESAARCDVRVILEGQTGTGKELIAKAIHKFSSRGSLPFVAIDCGAIPGNMIESELFGYKKGAFTGANQDRKGLMEEAHNGTLFMDEIANLPFETQSKFMRVLQEGEIRPLGANQTKKIDVRIISASSQSLIKMVEEGKFREDLYFRLHVYPLAVPPLSDRKMDIPFLADHFLKQLSHEQNKHLETIAPELHNYMKQRIWRGNIRELINFIERLVTSAPVDVQMLTVDHLPGDLKREFEKNPVAIETVTTGKSLNDNIASLEKKLILEALIENNWNQSRAARVLDIAEHTMRYKMKKLGIEKLD